jgi:hypothetical protein
MREAIAGCGRDDLKLDLISIGKTTSRIPPLLVLCG